MILFVLGISKVLVLERFSYFQSIRERCKGVRHEFDNCRMVYVVFVKNLKRQNYARFYLRDKAQQTCFTLFSRKVDGIAPSD